MPRALQMTQVTVINWLIIWLQLSCKAEIPIRILPKFKHTSDIKRLALNTLYIYTKTHCKNNSNNGSIERTNSSKHQNTNKPRYSQNPLLKHKEQYLIGRGGTLAETH